LFAENTTMTTSPFLPVSPANRHGFILAHETLCQGVTPAEWDDENPFVFYDTHAEAEAERVDAAEMRAEALEDAQMEPEVPDDSPWVEAAVLHPDGALTLPDQALKFTLDALRELFR
jgi:glycine/D-amino acid oxidase-like deaminating enzyme